MEATRQLELIKRIKALADTGLVYAKDEYDKERYEELHEMSLKLLSHVSKQPLAVLENFFMPVEDYPTPKVDVRGLVLNNSNEILMVKERMDGKWTIPGGWADIGYSLSEVVLKEIEEETGLKAQVVRLLAIYDKRCHPHPPQPFYVYKLNFLCRIVGGQLNPSFDVEDVGYFPIDKLPELSQDRVLESQLKHLFKMVTEDDENVYFD